MTKIKSFLVILILLAMIYCVNLLVFNIHSKTSQKEVVFWTVQLAPFSDYMNSIILDFEQKYPNITIKWVDIPYAEAEKRILASLLSSNVADLINVTSDFNWTLAARGTLTPIEDSGSEYQPQLLEILTYDQKLWGLPFYATSPITIYNKELMSTFKVENVAESYEELFAQISTAPIVKNKYIFMPTLTENDTLYKMLNKIGINSPEKLITMPSVNFLEKIKEFYTTEKIPKEAINQTHREVIEKYSSGQLLYLQTGANFLNIIKENSQAIYNKTDVATQFYGSEEANLGYDFSLMTLVIPKKSKRNEEALLFAKFLLSEENQLNFAKLTGVLPCNKRTLEYDYFSTYDEKDLSSKARFIATKQLKKPIKYPKRSVQQTEITNSLNNSIQKILLENIPIQEVLKTTAEKWEKLE